MTSKQLDSGKTPVKKVRAGRFQISLWAFRKLFSNGGKNSTVYVEQWVDVERACIQYSTFNKATGQFENQAIWCSADDLRNLARVVDQLNGEDDASPSPVDEYEEEEEEEDYYSPFEEEEDEDDSCSSFFDEDNEVNRFSLQSEEKSSMMKNDEVKKMRRMKLFNLVKHLKSADFYHDTFDLEEEGIEEVLGDYGICDNFSEEELQELNKDLYDMAERNEFREAVRLSEIDAIEEMAMAEII